MESFRTFGYVFGVFLGAWLFRIFEHVAFDYPTYHDIPWLLAMCLFVATGVGFIRNRLPKGPGRMFVGAFAIRGLAILLVNLRMGLIFHENPFDWIPLHRDMLVGVNWYVIGLSAFLCELAAVQLYKENSNKPQF
jgi:hypothetical protein